MRNKTQAEINDDIHVALFGDLEKGELGLVHMTREMWQMWSSVLWLGKIAMWLAVFFAAVTGIWMAIGSAIKHLFTGK